MRVREFSDNGWVNGKGFYSGWMFAQWNDGNQMWARSGRDRRITVERLISQTEPDTQRKDWHIVRRAFVGESKYPPILAGPFENIKIALVAFNLLYNQGEET